MDTLQPEIGIDQYQLIVVGSGFCGSTIANLAAKDGKRVLVIEKRPHIAGNMYDYIDGNGVLVQKYGPHIFHTNNDEVASYLKSIDDWRDFKFTYAVEIDGESVPAPFGFATIDRYYSQTEADDLKSALKKAYAGRDGVSISELLENNDPVISDFANLLYEKNYLPYALKQWQLPPDALSEEIIGRMPVRISDIEPYFLDKYQMLPNNGYTGLFEKMLSSPKIDIILNEDALLHISLDSENKAVLFDGKRVDVPVVYTGPLENLIYGKAGILPYRSLKMEFKQFDEPTYQSYSCITYPKGPDYLRSTDYSHFSESTDDCTGTTVTFEYPTPYDVDSEFGFEPYYPILTEESAAKNLELQTIAAGYAHLYPCGRLADFHYYNMDKALERAFEVYHDIDWG